MKAHKNELLSVGTVQGYNKRKDKGAIKVKAAPLRRLGSKIHKLEEGCNTSATKEFGIVTSLHRFEKPSKPQVQLLERLVVSTTDKKPMDDQNTNLLAKRDQY